MNTDTPAIPVEAFDLTLFFPFALRNKVDDPRDHSERGTARLDRWVKSITERRAEWIPGEEPVWAELDG